jgi:nucleoid DNA-binding protein
MPTRSKDDLVRKVAKELERPRGEVAAVLGALLDQIVKELAAGNEVRLTGYFSLGTRVKRPRTVRHPKTGVMTTVPARTKVAFTSGAKLKRWVETRLASQHFYGKRRESEEIPREAFTMPAEDIAGALGKLGKLPDE